LLNILLKLVFKNADFVTNGVHLLSKIVIMEHQESTRQQKVSRLIQKEIGTFLQRERLAVCGGKMVTVTNVRVTPDLGVARVYLSIFPSEKTDEVLKIIKTQVKTIRHQLGTQVKSQLRVVPELDFFVDDSLDYYEKINGLLKH
jgi:ribosome-binding factor A